MPWAPRSRSSREQPALAACLREIGEQARGALVADSPLKHSRAEASTSINFSQRRRRHALFKLPDVRRRLRIACPARPDD
jgi:hypothetical protein